MERKLIKRYSQALKQQVVREYESGASVYSLLNKYGISGHNTIKRWVEKHGREAYRSGIVMIQSQEDQLEVKAMKARISELESALAESVLDGRLLNTTLEVASRELKVDLKKTFGKK